MPKIWNLAVFKNNVRVGLETFEYSKPCLDRVEHWRTTYTADEKVEPHMAEPGVEIESCWLNKAQRVAILVYTQTV